MTAMDDAGYRIVRLAEADSADAAAVLDFWRREGAMDAGDAERRVSEVEFIALGEDVRLVAVSTVQLRHSERLDMDLWHFRTFVSPDHRRSALAQRLMAATADYLEARFLAGDDVRAAGVISRITSPVLNRFMKDAVRPKTGFVYIGDAPGGHRYWVRYFPGATVPPPPDLAA